MKIKQFFQGFYVGIGVFSHNIAVIVNTILLLLVYLIGVGLTSIFSKIVRKDFLQTKNSKEKTHWSNLNLRKKEKEDYYRQF